jgi:aspartyl/asparaginyl-tRNA synthetase
MPEMDYALENDVLQFAEEIVDYILAELRENHEEWYDKFQALPAEGQKMLFTAIADGFNDSTEN